jgi:hypothetical protein
VDGGLADPPREAGFDVPAAPALEAGLVLVEDLACHGIVQHAPVVRGGNQSSEQSRWDIDEPSWKEVSRPRPQGR